MSIKKRMKKASGPVAALWLLSGVLVGIAPMAVAFSPAGEVMKGGDRVCEFSLQLQNSVSVRKQYVARVIELTGRRDLGSQLAGGAAELKQVAYADDAKGDEEGGSRDLWGFSFKNEKRVVGLDPFSKDCLGCHDGVSASPIATDLRNDPFRRGSRVTSFGSDHPIGMDYNRYVAVNDRGYKPIPPGTKMILVDGKVGCLTCHNPLNPEKGHLVMSDQYSALCRTCHNK